MLLRGEGTDLTDSQCAALLNFIFIKDALPNLAVMPTALSCRPGIPALE